jgi:hypothetical protein
MVNEPDHGSRGGYVSTSIDDLIKRGYGYVIAAEVEGIGVVFAERIPLRVDAASAPSLPTSYTAASASLLIQSGQAISVEMDKATGVGRGDSWDMLLSWGALEDEGQSAALFKRATVIGRLTGALAYGATTIPVDDVTGWPSSGTAYLGRERIDYAGVDAGANTLTSCTRAVLGLNYANDANDPSDYKTLTTIPQIWRGRFVTLHQHIVSPEGRMLDATWLTGTFHREIWKGFIDSAPAPDIFGMRLRCLPIVRLLTRPFGAADELAMVRFGEGVTVGQEAPGDFPLVMRDFGDTANNSAGAVTITVVSATTASPPVVSAQTVNVGRWRTDWDTIYPDDVVPLGVWLDGLLIDMYDDLVTGGPFSGVKSVDWGAESSMGPKDAEGVPVLLYWDADNVTIYSIVVEVAHWCYWMRLDRAELDLGKHTIWDVSGIRFSWQMSGLGAGAYMPLRLPDGAPLVQASMPAASLGLLEAGAAEIIRWDDVKTPAWFPACVLIRISERNVGWSDNYYVGGPKASTLQDLNGGGTVTVVIGNVTDLNTAIGQILQSSGTSPSAGTPGARGDLDLLAAGYGLPAAWLNAPTSQPATPGFTGIYPLVSTGTSSLADLVGGMFMLSHMCAVQRRNSDGDIVIDIVATTSDAAKSYDPTVSAADVELAGHGVPQLEDGPNVVEVDTSAGPYARRKFIVKSTARIQQEGARALTLSAPGAHPARVVSGAASILHMGRGQSVVALTVAPWVSVQVGDLVTLTTAHPTQYDFDTAARSPASVSARVVGYRLDLWTGKQTITLKTSGMTAVGMSLCPTWNVHRVIGSVVTVTHDAATDLVDPASNALADGETVLFYRVGYEGTYEEAGVISSVSGNDLTMTGAPSAWVAAGTDIRVTYPTLASASTAQSGPYMFVTATKVWS